MGFARTYLKGLKLSIFENLFARKVNIRTDKAIFSFTFDDVPVSAATTGSRILENAGTTGTYYVALGIEDPSNPDGENNRYYINESEIQELYRNGHDIGCHTRSHLNLRTNATEYVVSDCLSNTKQLQKIVNAASIDHFSYPFGAVSPGGKRALGRKYRTLRTSDGGINSGSTDMTHLRAINLYSLSFNRDYIESVIQDAICKKGWLIFYSHDICESPSEWGTKTDDFRWVVDLCARSDGEILNVKQAYNKIIHNQSANQD